MSVVSGHQSVAAPPPVAAPRALPPGAPAEEPLYEVVNGRRVELPPMSILASVIASLLQELLGPYARACGAGRVVTEALFVLDAALSLRRRPDVAFVSSGRWPLDRPLPSTGDWEVVPDLAVEVISPNDLVEGTHAKVDEYFRHGVRQVWVVLPIRRQVYVYTAPSQVRIRTADEELDGGDLLPGLRLPVASIFPPAVAPPPPPPDV